MNLIIPFESKCKFESNVKEVCSISLEHEYTANDDGILGNFLISGTYKEHELSANILDFNFTVPFSVDITEKIDRSTIDFTIDNFTYDIENNEMSVKIDYIVSAENEPERVEITTDFEELFEEKEEPVQEIKEEKLVKEEIIEEEMPEETRNDAIKEINGIESYIAKDDDYDTYKVHIVKESETIESICSSYRVDVNDILNLNAVTVINPKDKIIIPIINE